MVLLNKHRFDFNKFGSVNLCGTGFISTEVQDWFRRQLDNPRTFNGKLCFLPGTTFNYSSNITQLRDRSKKQQHP